MARNTEEYIIRLKDQFSGTMGKAESSMGRFRGGVAGLTKAFGPLAIAGTAAMGAIAGAKIIGRSIKLYEKQAQAFGQVRQGLISTGNAANKTLDGLRASASAMQAETLFGDEDIFAGVTAQLLSFTNIANDEFDRTQQAALDITTRLYGADAGAESLRSTAILLGKALNDPVANLGALGRSGIQFSVQQKETIKTLTETGRMAEAQRIILTELEKQYGGSAKAAADASSGQQQFANKLGDLMEKIGQVLNPMVRKMYFHLGRLVDWLDRTGTATIQFLRNAGNKISGFFSGLGAVIENVNTRLGNFGQRLKNAFFASTGQWAKIKKVEKVGESVGEAWEKGFDKGSQRFGGAAAAAAPFTAVAGGAAGQFAGIDPAAGASGSGSGGGTTISGSAPKVFNINIEKVTGVETIETTNMRESATVIGNEVARAIAESLADVQTIAS